MKKRLFQNASINQITLLATLFSAGVIAVFAALVIFDRYHKFDQEMEQLRTDYVAAQKEMLVRETNRAMRYIQHKYDNHYGRRDTQELKDTIVEAIEYFRDERDGTGYIFIYTYDGVNIADPILKADIRGENMIDFTDPNGKRVIAELIEVAREGGGFVEYVWNKPIVNTLSPKISYAAGFEPFEWMIGTGAYLDDIEEEIVKREALHREETAAFVFKVIGAGLTLFIVVVIFSQFINRLIRQETDQFLRFFHEGATTYRTIDRQNLRFQEFLTLVDDANAMIATIAEKTESLRELNATLEDRVRQKTARLQAKKEHIEQLLEEQDRFVKNAIHEINTPLSVILVNIDLAVMGSGRTRHLTNIESGAKIIHNIYNDLSYLIQKDRISHEPRWVDLSQTVRMRLDFFRDVAAGAGLRIEATIAPDVMVFINPVELQRVVDNTLSNAIKYSTPESTIAVGVAEEGEAALFFVENSGDEIKDRGRLYERYYREDTVRGGFGLGLSIIKEICDKNGIEIDLRCGAGRNRFSYHFMQRQEP
jgi:signal transduction histidine kinase